MVDAELLKPIVEFLLKKRKIGESRPNNFRGKIVFLFSEIKHDIPGLGKLSQLYTLLESLKQKKIKNKQKLRQKKMLIMWSTKLKSVLGRGQL